MKNKAIFAISTAMILAFSPIRAVTAAETAAALPVAASLPTTEETAIERNEGSYTAYKGTIDEINTHENRVTILVSSKEAQRMGDRVYFHIQDSTVLLDAEAQESTDTGSLQVGQEVTVAYPSNTPVAMSYPPQLSPEVVIINTGMSVGSVKVDKFDEFFMSSDGGLKLNISDETPIVSVGGEALTPDDLRGDMKDRTLVVFYTITTRSIPPQTPPVKIIVLNEKETTVTEPAPEDAETNFYGEDFYEHEGHVMIPLAKAGEEYGFDVSWDDATRTVTLKGEHSTFNVTIGEPVFDNNGGEAQLSTAPQIYNDRSYVPMEFLDFITVVKL